MTQKIFTYKPQRLKNSNFCFWFFLGSQIFSSIYSCFLSAFCQLSCSKMTDRSTRSGFLNYYLQLRNFFFQKNSRNWKAIEHWTIKLHLFLYSNSYPRFFERKISVSLNWSFCPKFVVTIPYRMTTQISRPQQDKNNSENLDMTVNRKLDTIFLLRFFLDIWILEQLDNFTRYYSSKYQPTA